MEPEALTARAHYFIMYEEISTSSPPAWRSIMTIPNDSAASRRLILSILAVLGIVLALVGWYNWVTP